MINLNRSRRRMFWGAILSAAMVTGGSAHASVSISQVPLFLTQSVDPNVLFIIDDSGSMQWETMDDATTKWFGDALGNQALMWTFPRVADLHGGSPQYASRRTAPFSGNVAALFRSSHNNTVYYNPAITYSPWFNADGSTMADAPPAAAPNRPLFPGFGTRNLTQDNTQSAQWVRNNGGHDDESRTFYPAVYYHYSGSGAVDSESSYTRVEIKTGNAPFTGHGRENRTDCDNGACTYAQEIQNFANWYSYHRNRIFAARAGIGRAFSEQPENIRVGYGAINKGSATIDGESTSTVIRGVRPFVGTARSAFFEELYERPVPAAGTPLRLALEGAGEYFSRTDNRGPWGAVPGSNNSTAHLACRQSYSILMTDGYWNGNNPSSDIGNSDNTDGAVITGPGGQSFQYKPGPPFADTHTRTLADVAMHYWKRDLRPTLSNRVPTSARNEAFWQHMVTFGVGLGVAGSIDPDDAFAAAAAGTEIPGGWPDPTGSEAAKVDDLLHAGINSRGGFFSALDADTFGKRLSATLEDVVSRAIGSSASIATNSTRLSANTVIYQARFNSNDWSGQLLAYSVNESDGRVAATPNWDAAEQIPAPNSRRIFTINANTGMPAEFRWNTIGSIHQGQLGSEGVLNWLRGDRSNPNLRQMPSRLSDIVNSNPVFSSTQDFGFGGLDGEGTDYTGYFEQKGGKPEVIYVGSNGGMLHAFDANTGVEIFAYVPKGVVADMADLAYPNYTHRYLVDGSPRIFDAYVNGSWKTLLIGSTGAGGSSVFLLDISDPQNFNENHVLWEISAEDADFAGHLGVSVPAPTIARMADGNFWAILGNGYNSDDEIAKLILVRVDNKNTFEILSTGAGAISGLGANGLSSPIPVDVSGDRRADRIYAGDLHGNMWRFDTDSSNTNQWGFDNAFRQGNNPRPLFTAEDVNGNRQPITARPEVGRHPDGGVMVYFGTGTYFRTGDNTVLNNDTRHAFYGIRDQDSRVQDQSGLLAQTIIFEGTAFGQGVRVVSSEEDPSKTKGFRLHLISPVSGFQGERVVSGAILRFGRIIFTTLIPSTEPCDLGGTSWLMELDAISGGNFGQSIFDLNNDGTFDEGDYVQVGDQRLPVSGVRSEVGIISKPTIVSAGEEEYKYTSGSSGDIGTIKEISGTDQLGRQTWRQVR